LWRVKQAAACAWFGVGGEAHLQGRRVVARGAKALCPMGMQGESGYLTLASAGTAIRATDLKQAQCLKFRSQPDGDATGKRASGFPLAKWVLSYSTHLARSSAKPKSWVFRAGMASLNSQDVRVKYCVEIQNSRCFD